MYHIPLIVFHILLIVYHIPVTMYHTVLSNKDSLPFTARTVPGVGVYFSSLQFLQLHLLGDTPPSSLQSLALGKKTLYVRLLIFNVVSIILKVFLPNCIIPLTLIY